MQTRIVTRPAITAMALVIAWTAAPRATVAQQCRRTCETGETRDVRGCCVPAAKPARPAAKPARPAAKPEARPERTPRSERPAREVPEREVPTDKPSAPPAVRPSEPPAVKPSEPTTARPMEQPVPTKPEQTQQRLRQRRETAPAPSAASSGPTTEKLIATEPRSAPEKPAASQTERAGDGLKSSTREATQTETATPRRAGPIAPQDSDPENPLNRQPRSSRPAVSISPPAYSAAPQEPEPGPSRRWPVWIPWAVIGFGAVVTGVGEVLYNAAYNEYDDFDKKFSDRCPIGCNESQVPSDLADQLDRAQSLETTSRISMIAGGVTVAAGVTLVLLNQTSEPKRERITARMFVVPTLGPGVAGLSAAISF